MCDSKYWPSGKGKTTETVKRSLVAKGRGGGDKLWRATEFQGSETILCDTVVMAT